MEAHDGLDKVADAVGVEQTLGDIQKTSNKHKVKVYFYIAQYPVHWTAQSHLHFTPGAFSGTHSSHAAITREDYSQIFPLLSIANYSFIQMSELSELVHRGENENGQTMKR